ncbi:hypothetical protein CEXT_807481 [Caerostris extrusa]|uniref:Transmembrane protein n=1 Tax=Caerostris extrusa TaxID=172846 RepID=A0AAV4SYL8_CAEEX|nr:hypothetical protein CEXT_807481 [Caerostris extrusa]
MFIPKLLSLSFCLQETKELVFPLGKRGKESGKKKNRKRKNGESRVNKRTELNSCGPLYIILLFFVCVFVFVHQSFISSSLTALSFDPVHRSGTGHKVPDGLYVL